MATGPQKGFPGGSDGKESTRNVQSLGWEDPLEKGMAIHSSILDWRIPWTEDPGGLPWGLKESDMMARLTLHFTWALKSEGL